MWTEEQKTRHSERMKQYFTKHPMSEEWCKHISERTITPEWRLHLAENRRGKKDSETTRQRKIEKLKGRPVSEVTRIKIADTLMGHLVSEETRNKIGIASKEIWTGRTPEQIREHQEKSIHSPQAREKQQEVWDLMSPGQRQARMEQSCHSPEAREKQRQYIKSLTPEQIAARIKPLVIASATPEVCKRRSETIRIQYQSGERLPPARYGWTETNIGVMVRSSWEATICNLLTEQDVEWQYEPQVFDLGFITYRPDLYLPQHDVWIEVKGYWRDGERAKIDAFSTTHSLLIIDKDKYNQLVKDSTSIAKWLTSMRSGE